MAGRSFKALQSNLSMSSDGSDSQKPPLPPTVRFGRRTSSGRYISYSRDDLDSEIGSTNLNYPVHIPATPDITIDRYINVTSHVAILVLVVSFLWSNASSFINKSPPKIPKVHIPEGPNVEVAEFVRFEVNRGLTLLRDNAWEAYFLSDDRPIFIFT